MGASTSSYSCSLSLLRIIAMYSFELSPLPSNSVGRMLLSGVSGSNANCGQLSAICVLHHPDSRFARKFLKEGYRRDHTRDRTQMGNQEERTWPPPRDR